MSRPLLPWTENYQCAWVPGDLGSGVLVVAIAIPLSMGMAEVAGVPPVTGLYTGVLPLIAYACVGASHHLVIGLDASTAAMLAATVAPLAAGNSGRYLALAGGLTMMAGVVLVLASSLHLGRLTALLSNPALLGYQAGLGVIVIINQLHRLRLRRERRHRFGGRRDSRTRWRRRRHRDRGRRPTVPRRLRLAAPSRTPCARRLPSQNELSLPIFQTVLNGITVIGSIVGTRLDLAEVFALQAAGRTKVIYESRHLGDVNNAFAAVLDAQVPARLVFDLRTPRRRGDRVMTGRYVVDPAGRPFVPCPAAAGGRWCLRRPEELRAHHLPGAAFARDRRRRRQLPGPHSGRRTMLPRPRRSAG